MKQDSKQNANPWTQAKEKSIYNNDFEITNMTPQEIVLIDLQFVTYMPSVLEIAYFLFSSISTETRKNNLNDLLKLYHNELITAVKHFGTTKALKYTYDEFFEEFKKVSIYGFYFANAGPLKEHDIDNVEDGALDIGKVFEQDLEKDVNSLEF